jgi:HPt (histidine-containing phosphotransfer) domain-containing protein
MTNKDIIDQDAIENLRALNPDDGDVFLKEILDIFFDDTPMRIADLRAQRAAGDAAGFIRAAHSIKGSSSNVGAKELRALAERLEHHCRNQGTEGTGQDINDLELAFARAKETLQRLIRPV